MVLTLGDVLFATGKADLKSGATGNPNKLVSFLNQYPHRTAMIEGHTDNVGSDDYNLGLSQRRADAVKAYLMGQGIDARMDLAHVFSPDVSHNLRAPGHRHRIGLVGQALRLRAASIVSTHLSSGAALAEYWSCHFHQL
jgi:OmpA family